MQSYGSAVVCGVMHAVYRCVVVFVVQGCFVACKVFGWLLSMVCVCTLVDCLPLWGHVLSGRCSGVVHGRKFRRAILRLCEGEAAL